MAISTHMIETAAFGQQGRAPAVGKLWTATWAVARRNKFNGVTFEYLDSLDAAEKAAEISRDDYAAIEIVPVARRFRNDAEIARLASDAAAGDEEAEIFLALWPSILKTATKSAGSVD